MLKFRREYTKLINFTYSIYLGKPHVKQYTTSMNLSVFHENIKLKCPSFYNHNTHFMYSTGLNCSDDAAVPVLNNNDVNDENGDECRALSEDEEEEDEDEIGTGLSGLKDEKFNQEVEILLGILKRHEREGSIGVVNRVEVAEKLKGCEISPMCSTGVVNGVEVANELKECEISHTCSTGVANGVEVANDLKECEISTTCSTGLVNGVEVANELKECESSPTCSTGVVNGVEVENTLKECGISPTCSTEVITGFEVANKLKACEISPMRSTGRVNGVEVAKKLKECGIIPGPKVVIEVLSRIRNDWEVAFMFFLWVGKLPGYAHSLREYHSMISILAKKRKFDTAWILIDEMRKKGMVNRNTLLIMMRRYSATHDVVSAINTFHAFKRFDLSVGMYEFHQLLSALTRYKNVQEAEHLLFSNKNTFPFNTKSFNIILNGWCNVIGSSRQSYRFWRLMIDQQIKLDVISYSSIIISYSKSYKVKEAVNLFNAMKERGLEPDRKVYNAVMLAHVKAGRGKEALKYLQIMQDKGIAPDAATFNSLIKPLCHTRCKAEAKDVYDEMLRRGLQPNNRTFHAFMRIQRTEEDIFTLLDKMKELGCSPNKDTYQLLIRKFLRWRKLDKALMFWDKMKENGWNDDSSSYIALIHGLFLNGKLEEAHRLYVEMKKKSLLPDANTDQLIQTWLSNKEMANPETVISGPSW